MLSEEGMSVGLKKYMLERISVLVQSSSCVALKWFWRLHITSVPEWNKDKIVESPGILRNSSEWTQLVIPTGLNQSVDTNTCTHMCSLCLKWFVHNPLIWKLIWKCGLWSSRFYLSKSFQVKINMLQMSQVKEGKKIISSWLQ